MEEGEVQQYPKIYLGRSEGVFSLSSGGLRWKSVFTDTDKKIGKEDITAASWSNLKKEAYLRVLTKEGEVFRFDGFKKDDYKLFSDMFSKHFDRKLEVVEPSTAGYNWGDFDVKGNNLAFTVDEKTAIEVPLAAVSQCVLPGNTGNEVEIQFHEDDSADRDDDTLVEMRLYLPPGEEETTNAEKFQQLILNSADIRKEVGQSIVELEEDIGTFLTPRGRYAIEMYSNFFRMHGKTYDYKILYHSISRLFLLAKPDKYHVAFVISLEDPIRQGKQVYQHLVMQLVRDEIELPVNLPEDVLKEKYDGMLSATMVGQLPDVVAKVFKALSGKKVFVPGNFRTSNGESAVKCALKASEGFLYPLEKSFLFIHKPTTFIKFEDIDYVEFQRYSGQSSGTSSRNFDLHIQCKTVAGETGREYSFSAIDRKEYQPLIDFFSTKKSIRIKNLKESLDGDEDTKPTDYRHDPYKATLEAMGDAEEDEDDESDSDFAGDDGEEESDEDEEDSDFSEESEREEDKKSKKKEKPEKKRKRAKDEEDGEKKTKKRSKKDPSAPKKATTAFMLFSQENRPEVVKADPGLTFGEVGKKLGKMWGELDPSEKKKYQEKANEDKKRYQREMEDYDGTAEGSTPKATKKSKEKESTGGSKKPLTPYMFFANEKRAELKEKNPNMSLIDMTRETGRMWQELTAEEKKEWEAKSKEGQKSETEKTGKSFSKRSTAKASTSSKKAKSSKKPSKKKDESEEEEDISDEESDESFSGAESEDE